MKQRLWLALVVVMLARLPFLHISFFSVDEAVSAVAASEILAGGLPYRDAIDHRGPLTYYFYAAVFFFFGKGNMWAIHLIYMVLHLLITFGVYLLGKKFLKTEKEAAWAVLAYALFSSCNYFTEGLAAHTEWLLSLSVVAAWLVFFHKMKNRHIPAFLSGLLAGLAISSKQVAALDAAAMGLAIWLTKGSLRQKIQGSLWFSLGVVVVPTIFVYIFHRGNALQDLIFYSLTYNTRFYLPALSIWTRLLNGVKLLLSFSLQNWLIFPVLLFSLGWIYRKARSKPLPSTQTIVLLTWLGLSLLAALAGGRAFGHYLIPAFVPLAIWSGKMLGDSLNGLRWTRQKRLFYFLWLGVFVGGPLAWLFARHKHMLGRDPSVTEFRGISNYLKKSLVEGERIFVWGFAPEIYVLSEARPASRFTFCNPLSGHLPAANEALSNTDYAIVPGSWDSLERDFSKHPPRYIIDTQPAGFKAYDKFPIKKYPFFKNYLQTYLLDSVFLAKYPKDSIRVFERIKN